MKKDVKTRKTILDKSLYIEFTKSKLMYKLTKNEIVFSVNPIKLVYWE